MWRSLSNYHAKSPDLSRALSDVTLSVLVTKVSLVVAHQITKPTLMKLTAPHLKTRSLNLLSPKNKELHFLLANDALIVQVNKLALFFPWITKSLVPVCFFLFVVFFVSLTLFYSVLLHACWTVPMLLSAAVFLRLSARSTREKLNKTTEGDKEWVSLKWCSTVGYSVQYSLCFHLYRRCLWPFCYSCSFKTLLLLSLYSFLAPISQF